MVHSSVGLAYSELGNYAINARIVLSPQKDSQKQNKTKQNTPNPLAASPSLSHFQL